MMAGGEALEELSHELAGATQDLEADATALQVEQLPTQFAQEEHLYAEPLPPAPLDGDGKQ